nr:unnamed protein product [Haemonchus contortus]
MNVPPYIIAQLEKANDVIRRQSAELDRLRSSGLSVENVALRNQLMQVAQEYRRVLPITCSLFTYVSQKASFFSAGFLPHSSMYKLIDYG